MKNSKKSLLIHRDTKSDKTTSIIVDEANVVKETKAFLKKITENYNEATVDTYKPLGVVLKDEENKFSAVAYEKEKYVIVVPNGTTASAKLYGNWHEALVCAKRLFSPKENNEKKIRIVLAQYTSNN